jgi:hypothetical protein
LSGSHIAEAARRRGETRAAAERALRGAWSHLIVPIAPEREPTGAARGYDLHAATILNSSGDKPISVASYDKASREGAVADRLGGPVLALKLQELIGAEPHLRIRDIADWTARYVHMKRVRDEPVLARAIEEMLASTDPPFAYARGWDPARSTYDGLVLAKSVPVDLRGDGVLVRRDIADPLLRAAAEPVTAPPGPIPEGPGGTRPEPVAQPHGPRRFFGVVSLDATRPGPQISQIVQAVIAQLARVNGTTITLKLDIDAEAPADFPSEVVSDVEANAKTLKFEQSGFS